MGARQSEVAQCLLGDSPLTPIKMLCTSLSTDRLGCVTDLIGRIRVSVVVVSVWARERGSWGGGVAVCSGGELLTREFTYWPSGDVPLLRCGCWKTNPRSKSWHYTSTQLKLSREGQAEIVTRVWLHSDKVLAIQKQTNIQINIVLSLWQPRAAPWQCPNIAISICTPWIITQNTGILGRLKLFYYF